MKECMKPHALLHTLMGVGLGMLVLGLLPGLTTNAITLGVLLIIVAFAAEFFGGNPAKK